MCTFYLRLTSSLAGYRTRIKIGFALTVVTWLMVLISILFGCGLPFEKNWQIHPDPGNFCQPAVSKLDILMTVILNVITDLCKSDDLTRFFSALSPSFFRHRQTLILYFIILDLMTIPLPMLWQAKIPKVQKAALAVCFSGGLFVTMAGILRCVYILTVRSLSLSLPSVLNRHQIAHTELEIVWYMHWKERKNI